MTQTTNLDPAQLFEKLIELSRLSLQYGETYRATTYPDGKTFESDTDHSFMLGMIACSIKDLCAPELDSGKLAEYALVHDFVEVYAGDTATLGMVDMKEKEIREHEALARLKREWDDTFPWITHRIEHYEAQLEPEARFIKVLDKIMPSLTQIQNDGEIFARLQVSAEDIIKGKDIQKEWIYRVAAEWPLLIALYEKGLDRIFSLPYFQKSK